MATGDYVDLGPGWDRATRMAPGETHLFINAEGHIYKVHRETGEYTDLGGGWGVVRALGTTATSLWVVSEEGSLFRVNVETGDHEHHGGGWGDVTHGTILQNSFYLITHGQLYKVELDPEA